MEVANATTEAFDAQPSASSAVGKTVGVEDVARWGQFAVPTGIDLTLLERVLAATVEHIEANYYVADPMTDAQEQAVVMQASRLWRRRQSLDGVANFNEFGPIRVSSLDPDVMTLLDRQWGFA